jgi:predicted HicB family RNase H-like nuclease
VSAGTRKSKAPGGIARKGKAAGEKRVFTRDKTFLLRIPAELHELAKKKASDKETSLHEFILNAIEKAID